MYFITTKRMLEVCFSAHPNIQYRTKKRRTLSDISPKAFFFIKYVIFKLSLSNLLTLLLI